MHLLAIATEDSCTFTSNKFSLNASAHFCVRSMNSTFQM
jgi:hypothetical protein